MLLKVKKLHEDAIIPKYQTTKASGFDLHALEDTRIESGEIKLVRTGLAFELPENTELQIRPRSGLSLRSHLRIPNSPGTVDEDFLGEVCIIVENNSSYPNIPETIFIEKGQRIAQAVLCPILRYPIIEIEELTKIEERGSNGFGHSGT